MSAGDVTEIDKLRRIAEHETILLQTAKQIKMPEAEYQKCLDEIEKRYALQRFYTAIDFRNKVLLQEQYAILKKYGAVTRDIKKLYRRNRTVLHKLCLSFMKEGRTMCKISVIVPVYNAEGTLETALSSVFMQTLTDIEILCINDGSTDHSADVLTSAQRRDGRVRCLTQENAGAGMARNKGIAEAKGEYIAFLDADDLYPGPYALETLFGCRRKKAVPWSAAARLKKPRGTMCTPCLFSRRRAFITPAMSRSTVFSPALFIIAIFLLENKLQFPPLRVL